MSEWALSSSIASKAVQAANAPAGAPAAAAPAITPDAGGIQKVLGLLTTYVPTAVVTVFVALWSALVAAETPPAQGTPGVEFPLWFKIVVAVATGLFGLLWVWGEGHRAARKRAQQLNQAPPPAPSTFRKGWYEIISAGLAAFVWATAVPSSWAGFTNPVFPLAITFGAAILLQVGGMFFSPLQE
jgi:hypothetical protein